VLGLGRADLKADRGSAYAAGRRIEREIVKAGIERAIAEGMQSIYHSLDTIPGFGPAFSGGILTEIGDTLAPHAVQVSHAWLQPSQGDKVRRPQVGQDPVG
jgi:hypothetical protein